MPEHKTPVGLFVATWPESTGTFGGAAYGPLEPVANHVALAAWYDRNSRWQGAIDGPCTFHYLGVVSEAERQSIR